MADEWTIEAGRYGSSLDVDEDELEELKEIYDEGDISQYFSEDVIVLARDKDGYIIGGITESGGDELTIGIAEDWQGHGIATAMIKEFLKAGGSGFMVAGTDAGSEFLHGLYEKLTPDEREMLDVPGWADLELEEEI